MTQVVKGYKVVRDLTMRMDLHQFDIFDDAEYKRLQKAHILPMIRQFILEFVADTDSRPTCISMDGTDLELFRSTLHDIYDKQADEDVPRKDRITPSRISNYGSFEFEGIKFTSSCSIGSRKIVLAVWEDKVKASREEEDAKDSGTGDSAESRDA